MALGDILHVKKQNRRGHFLAFVKLEACIYEVHILFLSLSDPPFARIEYFAVRPVSGQSQRSSLIIEARYEAYMSFHVS